MPPPLRLSELLPHSFTETNSATEDDKKCQFDSEGQVNTALHLEMNQLRYLFQTGKAYPEEAKRFLFQGHSR